MNPAMLMFDELIRARVPLIAVVHRDLRWLRQFTLNKAKDAQMRVLEWTASQAWIGSEDLTRSLGLSTGASTSDDRSCAYSLVQFVSILRGAAQNEQQDDTSVVDLFALIHDIGFELDRPVVQRLLLEVVDFAPLYRTVVAIALPRPLAPDHPLRGACVEVPLEAPPLERYGKLVRDFFEAAFDNPNDQEGIALVCEALSGLTLAHAEAVLRLAWLGLDRVRDDREALVRVVAGARVRILQATSGLESE